MALSPVPIVAVILMLATPRARSNGIGFSLGWVGGLLLVSVVVLIATHGARAPDSDASHGVRWGTLAVGILFLAMALRQLRKRPKKGEQAPMPKWTSALDRLTPTKAILLGAVLSGANPKNLALTATAAAAIAQSNLSGGGNVVAVAVFVVIASLTVVGPVAFYLVAPAKAVRPLDAMKDFMSEHNAAIMFVVLLVLGVKLLGQGVAG